MMTSKCSASNIDGDQVGFAQFAQFAQFAPAAAVQDTANRSNALQSMHYGIRADILKKAIRKYSTLKIDFSANFNLTHEIFWAEALLTPQILANAKMNLQISI